jgi:hypothetical protein
VGARFCTLDREEKGLPNLEVETQNGAATQPPRCAHGGAAVLVHGPSVGYVRPSAGEAPDLWCTHCRVLGQAPVAGIQPRGGGGRGRRSGDGGEGKDGAAMWLRKWQVGFQRHGWG